MGVATEWYTAGSLCCYSLYSEASWLLKVLEPCSWRLFIKLSFGSLLSLHYGSHGCRTAVAAGYLLSCIVFLLGVCILSGTLSINERERLYLMLLLKSNRWQHYIDNYEFNLTRDLHPVLRFMVNFCPLVNISYFIADSSSVHCFSSLVSLRLAFRCCLFSFLLNSFSWTNHTFHSKVSEDVIHPSRSGETHPAAKAYGWYWLKE